MIYDYISRLSSFFQKKSNTEKNDNANNTETVKNTAMPITKEEPTSLNSKDEYTPSNLNPVQETYTLHDLNKKRITHVNTTTENNKIELTNEFFIDKNEQSGERDSNWDSSGNLIKQMMSLPAKSEAPKSEMAEMIEEMIKLLAKSAVEKVITKIIEQHGVELEKDDVITMSINRDGEFEIDAEKTVINGKTGDDVTKLCKEIAEDLNKEKTKDGEIFGEWLINQITDEMNIDLESLDESFSFKVVFEFEQNIELDLNEILHAHLTKDIKDTEKQTTTD
ncbi:MAG: hypothetical protein LBJ00_15635 [Planctomycetaceae bacterium]|jgi:hypothetical protein|nr:hypothetical protein [Planctomycetaceae bacterium]